MLIRKEDAARTHEDWAVLDVVSLRLKCNEYNIIASGKKDALIDRLVSFFRTEKSPTPPPFESSASENSEGEDELVLYVDKDPLIEENQNGAGDERKKSAKSSQVTKNKDGGQNRQRGKKTTNSKQRRTSPPPKPKQKQSTNTKNTSHQTPDFTLQSLAPKEQQKQQLSNQQDLSVLDNKMDKILLSLQSTQNEIHNIQSQQNTLQKRFDSELGDNRQKRTSTSADTASSKRVRANSNEVVDNNIDIHSVNGVSSAHHDDNSNQLLNNNNIAGASSTVPAAASNQGTNYPIPVIPHNSDPWACFRNPFLPPAMKETHLKKIEERNFVDFPDIHPDNQVADGSNSSSTPAIHVDQQSGLLSQKEFTIKKVKVNSFHRWSACWMLFAQAHLHYHPEDYFRLFTYHAIMVDNFNTYRYDACVKYDRDFRLLAANQRKLAPERQSVSWTELNPTLKVKVLNGNELIKCDYCKGTGHHVSACRQKLEDEAKNLPRQIAAAITEVFPRQQPTQQQQINPPPQQSYNTFRGQHSSIATTNHQSQGQPQPPVKIPPHQKPCRRFNSNTPCAKPPCQFLHACSQCGLNNHNVTTCYRNTSTNFIPIKHWGYGPFQSIAKIKIM